MTPDRSDLNISDVVLMLYGGCDLAPDEHVVHRFSSNETDFFFFKTHKKQSFHFMDPEI